MNLSLLEELIESGSASELDNLLNSNPQLSREMTSYGMSPLLLACYFQKHSLIHLITKHLTSFSIHEACALGTLEVVEKQIEQDQTLINQFSVHGFTPLGIATHFDQEDTVRFLLSKLADPNLSSQNGYSIYPIHLAANQNNTCIAKMLIEAGAEVHVFQNQRNTPLHFAAQNGNIDLIILLLEQGARVELKNENDETPADLAFEKGFPEIGKILKF